MALSSVSVVGLANGNEADGSPVVFKFERTGDISVALSVGYQLFGTAQAGSDYTGSTTGTISFAAGSATATLSLPALADGALIDPGETIIARIDPASGYSITTGKQFATATITAEGIVVVHNGVTYPGRGSEGPANRYAFAVIKSDGSVISWGNKEFGGNAPAGLTGVSQIFSTSDSFAALKSDGSVISWGNIGGRAPAGLTGVINIYSTYAAYVALKSDGTIICWGQNDWGGNAPTGITDVSQIVSTDNSFAVLKSDGSVISWGTYYNGSQYEAFTQPAGLTGVSKIFSNRKSFAALKTDGSVISWGDGSNGGSAPAGLTGVIQIFSTSSAFAALKSDGSVISWGPNNEGGSAPAGLTGVSQIFSNSYAFAALKSDGSVISWNTTAPAGLMGVRQIFSNGYAFTALKTDGSVISWGSSNHGGIAPAGLTGIIQIFFTGSAFAALKSDGSVVCWGDNEFGGVAPTGLTGVSQIFATEYAFAALKNDGSVISWGNKELGGNAPAGLTGVVGFANAYTDDRLVVEASPNNAPTGTPTLSGSFKAGQIITIDRTPIQDADNFTGYTPTYNYSFEVSNDNGTNWTKLTTTDATDNNTTYTLTTAEVGKQVRGVVSYLDGYGTQESVASTGSLVTSATVVRGNSLYTIVDGPSWTQAETNSVKLGGHLSAISSKNEDDFVWDRFKNQKVSYDGYNWGYWIGLQRPSGSNWNNWSSWNWINGEEKTNYQNKAFIPGVTGEPNGGVSDMYVHVWGEGSATFEPLWNDATNIGNAGTKSSPLVGIAETPFIRRGDSAYVIVQGPTWEEAEANAVKLGGHLVTINDAAENEWIKTSYSTNNSSIWIGFNDNSKEGSWVWSSGDSSAFTAWNSGEPDGQANYKSTENAAHLVLTGGIAGKWQDIPYNSSLIGIAEIKLAPNNNPTGTPTLSGTFKSGQVITIDHTPVQDADNFAGYTPDFKYTWEVSTNGTTWTPLTVTDATDNNNTYT